MTNETQTTNPDKTKPRRWFRFRLRTLLDQRRREKVVVAWIEEMGGEAFRPSYFSDDDRSWWEKTKDKWFGKEASWVRLGSPQVSDLSPLAELNKLVQLNLSISKQVSNLSPLAKLKNLKELYLASDQVTKEQLQELKLALPNCEIVSW